MNVSVIIPSLASEETKPYLKLCVESLRATTDWTIIVVTNGSPNPPVLNDIHGISTRLHTRDQGQCIAVNQGAQVVPNNTDYIMVCNDDMYFAPGWNRNLRFDGLCFSPNLVEPENNNGSAAPFVKMNGGFTLAEFNKGLVDDGIASLVMDNMIDNRRRETGFNLPFFIKKEAWDTIGGYDTFYDPWGSNSDTDLQTKIELAGIQPMRLRDVLVYHFSNKSGTFDGTHQADWQRNWDYYTEKWGFNRDDEPIPDTWMATNMVNKEKNIYHPIWGGRWTTKN